MKNSDNETIATIQNNQWGINNNPVIAHDRNYNSYALEVIDSHQIPAIQIQFSPENKLYIGGLFYFPNGILLATNDTTIQNPTAVEINSSLPRIFKYPSEEHLGETVTNGAYKIVKTSTKIIIIGAILTGMSPFLIVCNRFFFENGLKKRIEKRSRKKRNQKLKKKEGKISFLVCARNNREN